MLRRESNPSRKFSKPEGQSGIMRNKIGTKIIGGYADEALRRAHNEMETKVAERTSELANANEALQSDIAERKQMENALRQSEEKYRVLIENATDIIYTVDLIGKLYLDQQSRPAAHRLHDRRSFEDEYWSRDLTP